MAQWAVLLLRRGEGPDTGRAEFVQAVYFRRCGLEIWSQEATNNLEG
jgi:hypothetical protein